VSAAAWPMPTSTTMADRPRLQPQCRADCPLAQRTETNNAWVRLEFIGDGKKSNRNAIGARVEIEAAANGRTRFIIGGGSYLSASERRLLVGLGTADRADRVAVLWPSGRKQEFANLAARRWWRLHEGQDQPESVVPKPPATKKINSLGEIKVVRNWGLFHERRSGDDGKEIP